MEIKTPAGHRDSLLRVYFPKQNGLKNISTKRLYAGFEFSEISKMK
jgi:hypothetical protein